jgi:UDP-N-acetylglucosamine 2-epimerase (non-hydrolysing)
MKVINVVGARPNFMKIAPIMRLMNSYREIESILVHTGQHYDGNMSDTFFKDLEIHEPDIYLGVGSGTHAVQTALTMERFEKVLLREKPDLVLVVGDVNSTLACALVASKLHIKVAHVEAGLRSFDRSMPEEINRILTDHISDFLFTTCEYANANLRSEGILEDKIFFVGNIMVDALLDNMSRIKTDARTRIAKTEQGEYAVLTLHRPSNVDYKDTFERISRALNKIAEHIPIIFPVHPRTRKQIKQFGFEKYYNGNIKLLDPLGYLDFLRLYLGARFVLTDSGGIQEETTVLDIPCLTIRENTERPITVEQGTNVLVGTDERKIVKEAEKILRGECKRKKELKYWDGKTAGRIVKILLQVGKNNFFYS